MKILLPTSSSARASSWKSVLSPLVVLLIIVGFIGGFVVGKQSVPLSSTPNGQVVNVDREPPEYLNKDVDFSLFWRVWDYVKSGYLEQPVSETQLFYGTLRGLVASLNDPYSVFMDPDTAEKFNNELSGSFEGIGSEIGIKNDRLVIIAPLPDTPAERSGLRPGDRILAIDDYDTTGIALDYAVSLIKGPKNTKVTLLVLSEDDEEPRSLEIIRDRIKVDVIRSELKQAPGSHTKVGYIRLVHFSQESDESFANAWRNLTARGAQGLILDLRNNPGGFLDVAVTVASHWIKKDDIVVKEQFTPPLMKKYQSDGLGELAGVPTVVLVNQGSASASEIVAGALQDYDLATVVGETTFGKGSVQDYEIFPDGSSVKLTVAKWFTPQGRQIDDKGITPDLEVEMTRDDYLSARDPQLDKALELLSK